MMAKTASTFILITQIAKPLEISRATGGYDKATVQDVMLGAIEKRFGDKVPEQSIQWLTDNSILIK
nr:hypothetical protein HOJEAHOA_00007 [Escherichia coli]